MGEGKPDYPGAGDGDFKSVHCLLHLLPSQPCSLWHLDDPAKYAQAYDFV
jgi:hypothetical protein